MQGLCRKMMWFCLIIFWVGFVFCDDNTILFSEINDLYLPLFISNQICSVYNNKIYLFGGNTPYNEQNNSCWKYETITSSFIFEKPLEYNNIFANGQSYTSNNNIIYYYIENELNSININNNKISNNYPLIPQFYQNICITVQESTQNVIINGGILNGTISHDTFVLNNGIWKTLSFRMYHARHLHNCKYIEFNDHNLLYSFGGVNTASIEYYNQNSWNVLSDTITLRHDIRSVLIAHDDLIQIYVFGGNIVDVITIYQYNNIVNTVTTYNTDIITNNICPVYHNGYIYLFGGTYQDYNYSNQYYKILFNDKYISKNMDNTEKPGKYYYINIRFYIKYI